MEISILALIGIGLGAMFFGYFFGLFEGRGQGYKRRKQDETDERPGPAATPGAALPSPKIEQGNVLLELSQNESGEPQLHIDGREVEARRASADQRRRLIDLMVMLKPWVEPGSAMAPAPLKPAAPKPTSAEQASMASARSVTQEATTGAATSVPSATAAVNPQMSLVGQIDAILQIRLAGTPLAGRAIRLAESLHGGATVFVGSTQYDGVDKVPDPEIQSAIRAAISEWEKKYTPG